MVYIELNYAPIPHPEQAKLFYHLVLNQHVSSGVLKNLNILVYNILNKIITLH